MYAFASLLTNDAAKRQAYLDAVSQYADFALGLNPLGRSFVTGLGADVVQSPTHLDSYFTKAGLSDGVSSEHVGKPIGNVPGIVVFGPTEGRSGAAYQTAVSNKVYPRWESLPGLRRWADGWSLINGNEFSTWETMVWNVAMHGFLYDAGKDPNARLLPGECTGSAPAAQTRQLACPAGQAGGIAQNGVPAASAAAGSWAAGRPSPTAAVRRPRPHNARSAAMAASSWPGCRRSSCACSGSIPGRSSAWPRARLRSPPRPPRPG
ncbi:glycoside hydrolase family 9 protein [Massilia sp. Se16.2.3]|uniref:glycoside hydrolase family 9 protein n=1 Tax=Massilia sp. Se16.2.3 TaxID=2709303 RepID=UPI0015FF3AFE|nr:glycoside hydrolase family 9 protein [Massilia sp. Se16.2.3]QNA99901.1 hypothetical protein G4G31_15580 [Massilia sp. Se16.2.3]